MIDSIPDLQVHPLAHTVLRVAVWLIGGGAVLLALLALLGRIRREDVARYLLAAVVGLANLVLGALGPLALLPGALVIAFLAWRELLDCIGAVHEPVPGPVWVPLFAALSLSGAITGDVYAAVVGIAAVAWAAIVFPLLRVGTPMPVAAMTSVGLGSVLVSIPIAHVLLLLYADFAAFALLVLLAHVFEGVAAALGRLARGPVLAPRISPRLTWFGTLGAIVACLTAAAFFPFLDGWTLAARLGAAALVALFSLLGHLVAASMKREAGLRQFSGLFPGLGGVLDRFDGLLFSAPALYAFVYFF